MQAVQFEIGTIPKLDLPFHGSKNGVRDWAIRGGEGRGRGGGERG